MFIEFLISGVPPFTNIQNTPEGIRAQIWVALSVFFLTLLTLFRSVACHVTKKLPAITSDDGQSTSEPTLDMINNDCHPPSSSLAYTEADQLSFMLKKLGELEEKVDTLQSRPSEMPNEKEELLNAAVCRVDALEAELIATKKVGCYNFVFIHFQRFCSLI